MDCGYYYNIAICDFDPAEDNYEEFCNMESTREAAHEAAPYICQRGSTRRLPGRQNQRTTHCRESIATLQLLRLNPTLGY